MLVREELQTLLNGIKCLADELNISGLSFSVQLGILEHLLLILRQLHKLE